MCKETSHTQSQRQAFLRRMTWIKKRKMVQSESTATRSSETWMKFEKCWTYVWRSVSASRQTLQQSQSKHWNTYERNSKTFFYEFKVATLVCANGIDIDMGVRSRFRFIREYINIRFIFVANCKWQRGLCTQKLKKRANRWNFTQALQLHTCGQKLNFIHLANWRIVYATAANSFRNLLTHSFCGCTSSTTIVIFQSVKTKKRTNELALRL